MKFLKVMCALLLVACLIPAASSAQKYGSSGSSSRPSTSSGGSKPSTSGGYKPSTGSGSKPSTSGGSKPSSGSGTKPTVSKPSSGSKPLPKPVTQVVPKTAPPTFSNPVSRPRYVPSGANYSTDYNKMSTGRYTKNGKGYYYADPYGPDYFGAYNSPLLYLWIYSWLDDDVDDHAVAPESDGQVGLALLSYMQVITAMQEQTAGKDG